MERVLVVGGAGFIGSRCVAALEAEGCVVTVVDSFVSGRRATLERSAAMVIEGDPRAPSVSEAALDARPDVILYVGGVTDTRISDAGWMMTETLEPFRAVTDWARTSECRLVYASSAAVYGNGNVPMHEAQERVPHNAYGRAKVAMEELASGLLGEGMSPLGLRYFNVYGPGEAHKGAVASMIRQLAVQLADGDRIRLFEDGRQRRDFVHVEDVVRATLLSLESSYEGVVNVGTGNEHSFSELAATVARALERHDVQCEFVPPPSDYQARTCAETSRAAAALGFEAQVSFDDGVSSYASAVAAGHRDATRRR